VYLRNISGFTQEIGLEKGSFGGTVRAVAGSPLLIEANPMSIHDILDNQPLASIPLEPVVRVEQNSSLADALAVMSAEGAGFVLVYDGDTIVGIFTERDVVMNLVTADGVDDRPLQECMTRNPVTLPASRPVSSAIQPMVEGSYRHLPLIDDDGTCVGVLSIHSLFSYLAELLPGQLLNLPPRPHQEPSSPEGA
jgi:CBS domain-containing protein